MSNPDHDDQPATSGVQGQLDGLLKEMKEMAVSITMLIKAITPQNYNAVTQSDTDDVMDPQTVPNNDPKRARDTEEEKEGDGCLDHGIEASTYPIQEPLAPSLIWPLRLKKPIDNQNPRSFGPKKVFQRTAPRGRGQWTIC